MIDSHILVLLSLKVLAEVMSNNSVYVDESPFQQAMNRRRGRSIKGKLASALSYVLRGINHSVWAAIIPDYGLIHYEIFKGKHKDTSQSVAFAQFCSRVILKMKVKDIMHPCWWIMDNAAFHKKDLLEPVFGPEGHLLHFLPRYTPDFNPIENCFNVWKAPIKRVIVRDDTHLRTLIFLASRRITAALTKACWERSTSSQFAKAQRFEDF